MERILNESLFLFLRHIVFISSRTESFACSSTFWQLEQVVHVRVNEVKGWFLRIVFPQFGIVAIARFLKTDLWSFRRRPTQREALYCSLPVWAFIYSFFIVLRLLLHRFHHSHWLPWATLLWLKLYSIKCGEGRSALIVISHWSWFLEVAEEGIEVIIHFQGVMRTQTSYHISSLVTPSTSHQSILTTE